MKDQNHLSKKTTSNTRSLKNDPCYFAHYLNMARHNAYVILKDITERFKIQDTEDLTEENLNGATILQFIKGTSQPDRVKGVIGALIHHFPFLEVQQSIKNKKDGKQVKLSEKADAAPQPRHISLELSKGFHRLNQLRNNMTHYYQEEIFHLPETWLLMGGSRTVTNAETGIFQLEPYFISSQKKILARFPFLTDEHIKHLNPDYKDFQFSQQEKLARVQPKKKDEGPLKALIYTEKGLAYFICLFLDRKNAFRFLSRLEGFKNSFENEGRATLECFTHYSCRLPRPKLGSANIKLDILNELTRCPSSLYKHLGPEDQQKFKIQNPPSRLEIEEEDNLSHAGEVEMKRHGDRFPYFALRYFDDTNAFNSLRFHMHLAKLRTKEIYPKEMYGEERERVILRNIRAFGRWKVFDDSKMPESWLVNDQGKWQLAPNIEQFSPHYQITGNRIALKFIHPLENAEWPSLSSYTASGLEREKQFKPDAILSTFELQNMYFYHHLFHKGWIKEDVEGFLLSYIKRFRHFCQDIENGKIQPLTPSDLEKRREDDFNEQEIQEWIKQKDNLDERERILKERKVAVDVRRRKLQERKEKIQALLDHYGLQLKDIPDQIQKYLLGYQVPDQKEEILRQLSAKIKEEKVRKNLLLRTIDRRIERVESSSDRILNGEMASYLASDLVYHKPPNQDAKNYGKPNNDEYRILQSSIAYFTLHKKDLIQYFRDLGLIGKEKEYTHPFLFKTQPEKRTGVMDFYEHYLIQKIKWLSGIRKNLKEDQISVDEFHKLYGFFLSVDHKKIREKSYASTPVFLPRGLFNQPVAKALQTQGFEVKEGDSLVRCLEAYLQSDTQAFYLFPRVYSDKALEMKVQSDGDRSIWDNLQSNIQSEIDEIDHLESPTEEERYRRKDLKRFYQKIRKNEQEIRYTQSTDRVLWLIFQEMNKEDQLNIDFSGWSLANVGFDSTGDGKNVLDAEVSMEMVLSSNPGQIIWDKLPIKRYGDFRRFFKDRRLVNLLKYFQKNDEKISREILEEELDHYDRLRETLFEKIWAFERVLFERYGEKLLQLFPNKSYINHRLQLSFVETIVLNTELNQPNLDQIALLRNKFLHNEIPFDEEESVNWAKEMVKKNELEGLITEKLIKLVENVYDNLIDVIISSKTSRQKLE